MKKKLCILLALSLIFAMVAACGSSSPEATPEPPPAETPEPTPEPQPEPETETPDRFLWNDFVGYDPSEPATGEFAVLSTGMARWWANLYNLRAGIDNDVLQLEFRPGIFDPDDFDDIDHFFASAGDWMGNWGEAINMWAMEGIDYCRYLTIRMAGAIGGEENALILHFQPEDGPSFSARFADLRTADGGWVEITTDMQDIVIDLEASGFPGMTNRMHIRAFAAVTVFIDEIYFSEPVGGLEPDAPLAGMPAEIGTPASLPIRNWATAIWNDFVAYDPDDLATGEFAVATTGISRWWGNLYNLEATIVDGSVLQIDFEQFGNWGEALNMWAMPGISSYRFLVVRMAGGSGGEENSLLLHFQPEDGPAFVSLFADLVTAGGSTVELTTDMQEFIIDLEASGFPGMTNRMHIRSSAANTLLLDEIFFFSSNAPINPDNPLENFPESMGDASELFPAFFE